MTGREQASRVGSEMTMRYRRRPRSAVRENLSTFADLLLFRFLSSLARFGVVEKSRIATTGRPTGALVPIRM